LGIFINFSNHPSDKWSEEQLAAAQVYGDVVDIPFPNIEPAATETDIANLGNDYIQKILEMSPSAVMCQGEFTFSYYVISGLLRNNINVLSACSKRIVQEMHDGTDTVKKVSQFKFVGFRRYIG
jgi:hypothetical protein